MSAAARLTIGRSRGRRGGAIATRTAGRSWTAGAMVTVESVRLGLFFRRLFLAAPRDLGHDSGIGKRRGVAQGPVLRDVAQQATHDLARAGLGQLRREDDVGRGGELPDDPADMVAQLLEHL